MITCSKYLFYVSAFLKLNRFVVTSQLQDVQFDPEFIYSFYDALHHTSFVHPAVLAGLTISQGTRKKTFIKVKYLALKKLVFVLFFIT